ncbi:hypothetical protein TIFTF001_000510 [Ficus carica]|uniref:Very-long-chain (3R)-3-hydroxyacyl-CoA dehydratase n=1 Tax=Ficus carica TaxID=3494 RepID=A0AA87ZDQ7_FICCA|nr:hypothetical protein TIFTF001_000510 [Ficus carica]
MTIVRRGGRRQRALGCIEKGRMGAGTSIVKKERAYRRWDGLNIGSNSLLKSVIRYPHHALNCIGKCPYWIVYLRYTAFTILYPIGESAEIWVMYKALSCIHKTNLFGDIFPCFPFLYYNFLSVFLLIYPLLWLKLYLHLFKQRKLKLGNGNDHEKKKKK